MGIAAETLLIAEPREIVRLGLRAALAESRLKIVGEATDVESVLRAIAKHRPDAVLLAVHFLEGDGMSLLARLRRDAPESRVIMFADDAWPSYLSAAISGGADGMIVIADEAATIAEKIAAVAGRRSTWTARDRHRADGGAGGRRSRLLGRIALTLREFVILRMLARGLDNRAIAGELTIGTETVKEHLGRLMRKLGVFDRTQAAVWAARYAPNSQTEIDPTTTDEC